MFSLDPIVPVRVLWAGLEVTASLILDLMEKSKNKKKRFLSTVVPLSRFRARMANMLFFVENIQRGVN